MCGEHVACTGPPVTVNGIDSTTPRHHHPTCHPAGRSAPPPPGRPPGTTGRRRRVGFDVDGVLYPLVDVFRTHAHRSGVIDDDCPARYPSHQWHFWRDWNLTWETFVDVYADGVQHGNLLDAAAPYTGAANAVRSVAASNCDIIIVTARTLADTTGLAVDATRTWLTRWNIPYTELHVTERKTDVELDVMIEDSGAGAAALRAAGVDCWLLDQPWNRTAPGPRVSTLDDYAAVATGTGQAVTDPSVRTDTTDPAGQATVPCRAHASRSC